MLTNRNKNTFAVLAAVFIFLFYACNKLKNEEAGIVQSENKLLEEKFFTVNDSVPESVKKISAKLLSYNRKQPFLNSVINQAGFPKWEKSLLASKSGKPTTRLTNETDTNYIFIPLVPEKTTEVNGVFACKAKGDSILSIKRIKKNDYNNNDAEQSLNENADQIIGFMMFVQNKVYNTENFVLIDKRIFSKIPRTGPATARLIRYKEDTSRTKPISNKIASHTARWVYVDFCYTTDCFCGEVGNGGYQTFYHCDSYALWSDNMGGEDGGSSGGTGSGSDNTIINLGQINNSSGGGTGSSSASGYLQTHLGLTNTNISFFDNYYELTLKAFNYYFLTEDGQLNTEERRYILISHLLY
mgnify:CR=1 FL=1